MSTKTLKRAFKLLFFEPWFKHLATEDKREYYILDIIGDYTEENLRNYIEKIYDVKQWDTMRKRLERIQREEDQELQYKLALVDHFNKSFKDASTNVFYEALEHLENKFKLFHEELVSYCFEECTEDIHEIQREYRLNEVVQRVDTPKQLRGWREVVRGGFREEY